MAAGRSCAGGPMTSDELWRIAVDTAGEEVKTLDPCTAERVRESIGEIMLVKRELASLFESAGGVAICTLCRGECCRVGSFHVTAVELLAYQVTDRELFTPAFTGESCPYLGSCGCMMDAPMRPYNCVTFLCERVYEGMGPEQLSRYSLLSDRLLDLYRGIERLFSNHFRSGILESATRYTEGRSRGILRS